MAVKGYTLTIAEPAAATIAEIAERVRAAGFEVTQQLDAIGVLVGRADEADLPRIRAVPGVAAVDEDRTVRPWPSDGRGAG